MADDRRGPVWTLLPSLGDIVTADLATKVAAVWTRLWRESGFARIEDVPWWSVVRKGDAGKSVSLITHVNLVADCAKGLARVARRSGADVDLDVLLAGALLQDVDKLVLLDPQTFEPTEIALNSQHTFYGAHVALEEGVPWPVVHLILSHSKNTGVRPRTLEAVILHYADYAVVDIRNVIEGRDELFAEHKPKWARR
jgi:hypothetical protein